MPKSIPATGEAMPELNRRAALKGGLVLAVTAHTVAGVAIVSDPLLDAVKAYRAGLIQFNQMAASDNDDKLWEKYSSETYGPWQEVLNDWDEPAKTREGAIEALRSAISDEDGVYGTPAAERMIKAALGYLEGVAA